MRRLDASHFLGRLIKHILGGGFVYLMIVNAFPWMNAVITSFSDIGAAVSGLPNLSPQSVPQLGGKMAQTIFDAPASTSVMSNLEMAIIQSVSGFVVLLAFTITAMPRVALPAVRRRGLRRSMSHMPTRRCNRSSRRAATSIC